MFSNVEQRELEAVNGGLTRSGFGGDMSSLGLGGAVTLPGVGSRELFGSIEVVQPGLNRRDIEDWDILCFCLIQCSPYNKADITSLNYVNMNRL